MRQDAPAQPLQPGRTYIIAIEGSTGGGIISPSRGTVSFAIGSEGAVTSCYNEESECR